MDLNEKSRHTASVVNRGTQTMNGEAPAAVRHVTLNNSHGTTLVGNGPLKSSAAHALPSENCDLSL